jgi:serine/threonine protein kinase
MTEAQRSFDPALWAQTGPVNKVVEPDDLPVGTVIGRRYRIDAHLKWTRALQTYRATELATGRTVKLRRQPDFLPQRQTRREAAVLEAMDHPRVPRFSLAFKSGPSIWFVQSFIHGPTLFDRMRLGPLPRPELVAMLRDALEAIAYMQALPTPVIHRDIKPGNMVLTREGAVLIDFGLAVFEGPVRLDVPVSELTNAHTTGYAPPEQMIALEANRSSDPYALAATALYAATGTHPSRHWDARRARMAVPDTLDVDLAEWLRWLLEPAAGDRCPDARTALAHLPGVAIT